MIVPRSIGVRLTNPMRALPDPACHLVICDRLCRLIGGEPDAKRCPGAPTPVAGKGRGRLSDTQNFYARYWFPLTGAAATDGTSILCACTASCVHTFAICRKACRCSSSSVSAAQRRHSRA